MVVGWLLGVVPVVVVVVVEWDDGVLEFFPRYGLSRREVGGVWVSVEGFVGMLGLLLEWEVMSLWGASVIFDVMLRCLMTLCIRV
jgi:hypothetical protein